MIKKFIEKVTIVSRAFKAFRENIEQAQRTCAVVDNFNHTRTTEEGNRYCNRRKSDWGVQHLGRGL
jgi:hypothetical protein